MLAVGRGSKLSHKRVKKGGGAVTKRGGGTFSALDFFSKQVCVCVCVCVGGGGGGVFRTASCDIIRHKRK